MNLNGLESCPVVGFIISGVGYLVRQVVMKYLEF